MSNTNAVLDHHLEAFAEQELEEIMSDYVDASVVVTNVGTSQLVSTPPRLLPLHS
jgi:hypothetical protein